VKQNLISGLFLLLVGLFFLINSLQYDFGNLRNIGPGFFPTVLSIMLIIFGIIISLQSYKLDNKIFFNFKSFLIIATAIFLYALTFEITGIIISTIVLILIYSMLLKTNWQEKLFMIIGISIFNFVLFFQILEISIRFW
jgi:putative tricarboxylic transport membrane protein